MVLYQPDWKITENAVKSLAPQVCKLCIVDNTPNADNSKHLAKYKNVEYIPLKENRGIATAQNIGIRKLLTDKFDFVLFSDQDSIAPSTVVTKLIEDFETLSKHMTVGVIGPTVINRATGETYKPTHMIEESEIDGLKFNIRHTIISSFSLVRLDLFKKIGLFREDLFIDFVENEWHFRLAQHNINVIQSKRATIQHELGDTKHFLGQNISIASPMRLYYQFRNFQILKRLPYIPEAWVKFVSSHQWKKVLYYPIMPSNRIAYTKAIIRGVRDGRHYELSEIEYPS